MSQTIQFKKQRELGEILTDTFKFIRENFKPLGLALLKITGPVFLILILAVGYYSWATVGMGMLTTMSTGGDFIISMLVLLFAYFLYINVMFATVYHSILSYIQNDGEIITSVVASGVKDDILKLMVLTFVSGVLTGFGFMLLFIPGIWVMVPLSFTSAILVFRGKGFSDSLSECFELVKENWWMTFASILVIGIIVYLIGVVFQIPAIIYFMVQTITTVQEGSATIDMFGTGYVVISVLSSALQYIVYCITPIAWAFIYFNLNEKKHFTGTYETIQNLGNN